MLSAGGWRNAKAADAIRPAGRVTPSAKVWTGEGNPDAETFTAWIERPQWTTSMCQIADFAQSVALKILGRSITVKFCASADHLGQASYGPSGVLVFNKFRLGNAWFDQGITSDVVELIIHEFGHEYSPDHLSAAYHEALCRIGAAIYRLAKRGEL
jgi:hypothetical protein